MPQILKDEVRNRIVEAAKQEFMENTYERTSMRNIASRSNITVGNLYRYFTSKEELNQFIVRPALEKLQELVLKISNNQVDILNMENISLTSSQMRDMLDSLADGVVDIYSRHRIEMNILMMRTNINRYLVDWFTEAIASIIANNFGINKDLTSVRLLGRVYAESVFSGFITMLKNSTVSNDELKKLAKLYMESYVDMMDLDLIDKLKGELV
ncbi:MAG: TetR/AcrR family transcriptional regulator [Erysipelotrichaceae bacterium]|nr:TetR/AcrR family transcriptional regulator [Erysipelotrichaceae bacterium]MBQ1522869.1 TetR/AcrR family transcriptional regulator [Erysipelotrichaceae bacterium]